MTAFDNPSIVTDQNFLVPKLDNLHITRRYAELETSKILNMFKLFIQKGREEMHQIYFKWQESSAF